MRFAFALAAVFAFAVAPSAQSVFDEAPALEVEQTPVLEAEQAPSLTADIDLSDWVAPSTVDVAADDAEFQEGSKRSPMGTGEKHHVLGIDHRDDRRARGLRLALHLEALRLRSRGTAWACPARCRFLLAASSRPRVRVLVLEDVIKPCAYPTDLEAGNTKRPTGRTGGAGGADQT